MKRPLPDNGQKTVQKVLHHLYDTRKLQRGVLCYIFYTIQTHWLYTISTLGIHLLLVTFRMFIYSAKY